MSNKIMSEREKKEWAQELENLFSNDRNTLQTKWVPDMTTLHKTTIMDSLSYCLAINNCKNEKSDRNDRLHRLLINNQKIINSVSLLPYPIDVSEKFKRLIASFPNFNDITNLIYGYFRLATLDSNNPVPIQLPNILILGEAGIGKTRFVKELSEILDLYCANIPISSATSSFLLGGLEFGWSTGGPGEVFNHLAKSVSTNQRNKNPCANPIFILDELDKAQSLGSNSSNPLSPLYSLLEKDTAKNFEDVAVKIPINASFINWFATANDILTIPDTPLSRFRIFQINNADKTQMKSVILSVWDDIYNELPNNHYFNNNLSVDLVEYLSQFSPRTIKRMLEEGAVRSIVDNYCENNRFTIKIKHISTTKNKIKMGFMP